MINKLGVRFPFAISTMSIVLKTLIHTQKKENFSYLLRAEKVKNMVAKTFPTGLEEDKYSGIRPSRTLFLL